MRIWINKGFFSGTYIGVIENDGDRMLFHDTDTIEQIERKLWQMK